jgi:hypothetical protein
MKKSIILLLATMVLAACAPDKPKVEVHRCEEKSG